MDRRQVDIILIRKLPHGGYTVSDYRYRLSGGDEVMLFAGELHEALSYVNDALTHDERCKAPDKGNVA